MAANSRFTAWATSPDRAVTVLAAPGGVPVEVHLQAAAMRLAPDVLARVVLETARRAGGHATAQLRRELAATVGDDATRVLDRAGLVVPPDLDVDDPEDDGPGGFGPVLRSAR